MYEVFMSLRKIVFWLHLTAGCLAGGVILIMSVTGVLLAYERQITRWPDRGFRSTATGAVRLPMEDMLARAIEQNQAPPTTVVLRADPWAPAEVSFGRDHVLLVDTYSGAVLGEASPGIRAFFQRMEAWHRWLGASNENRAMGRAITGACNFLFLLLVVSGPFLWIPRKWLWRNVRAVAWFRGGLSGKARDYNWHNVIGLWCAVPLFLIVLSGVVMSYPWANNLLYRMTGNEPPAQGGGQGGNANARSGRGSRDDAGRAPNLVGPNALWTRAEQQVPGWQSLTLRLQPSGRGPATFTIDTGNGGRPDQRSQLTLNRGTAEVVRWEPFSSYNAGRQLRSWFRFLHTGEAGGIAGETIAGIASTGATVLVWTGIWLACRRLVRSRKRKREANGGVGKEESIALSN
jgi:uncharacterized iron-regulated membrane protein